MCIRRLKTPACFPRRCTNLGVSIPGTTAAGNQTQLFISSVPESVAENRYTFVIFREPAGYVANPAATASRIILNITQLAASEGLTLVGANYFLEGQKNNIPSV